ncbi:hypothetical protein [Nonomuraea sp. NPDC050643]|uniref:hypothetical protein n=1 Tax=Nonomuraea sp. NPDC050643 TaxID=3155660 RepID=UPI0033D786DF
MSLSQIGKIVVEGDEVTVLGHHSPSPEHEGKTVHYFFVISADNQVLLRGNVTAVFPSAGEGRGDWGGQPVPRPKKLVAGLETITTVLGVVDLEERVGFHLLSWTQQVTVTGESC